MSQVGEAGVYSCILFELGYIYILNELFFEICPIELR
jgi:hypothetical protein